ncbi:MAG TPA: hypothetical protein VF050_12080 [Moraxellaceae bacterium]
MGQATPFSANEADLLFVQLNEEIFRLEEDLSRFHECPPERRLPTPEAYREQIRVRRELLQLLDS